MLQTQAVSNRPSAGFTLMEMAVVLAIIGLLVGAVVGGASLLKQSELQTVTSDFSKYSNAVAQFRQQYGGWPGDLLDATNYWGDDNSRCGDANIVNGNPGTCNGDNDGVIGSAAAEPYLAWQHLKMARYIEGNYNGIASNPAVLGTNVPKSRIQSGGWSFGNNTSVINSSDWYNNDIGNYIAIGSVSAGTTQGPILTAPDAWQVDKKVDDGLPAAGRVVTLKNGSTLNGVPASTCATTAVDATAVYAITSGAAICNLNMSLTLQ